MATREPRPAAVALGAFLLGGLGNVAFSLHAGSPLGLAFHRYLIGFALFSVLALTSARTAWAALRNRAVWGLGLAEAGAVTAFMHASESVSTLVFMLVGSLAPVLVIVLAPLLGHRRLGRKDLLLAGIGHEDDGAPEIIAKRLAIERIMACAPTTPQQRPAL